MYLKSNCNLNHYRLKICGQKFLTQPRGHFHLQYLIAYSMQIRRGKAWEIWSRAVTSGRLVLDTWGTVSDEESQSFFLCYQSEGWRPER